MNKIKQLHIETDSTEDYQLIGISSPSKEYRLAYYINKTLGIDLRRQKDLNTTIMSEREMTPFSLFFYPEEECEHSYYLLSNSNTKSKLIPDLGTTDYFLLIRRHIEKSKILELIHGLQKISLVQTAFMLDLSKIRGFFYVLDDLEEFEDRSFNNSAV